MIDKKSIIKMANDVLHRSQGYPDRRLLHPSREWGIGLVVFALVVITGSFFVGNIFIEYRSIDTVQSDAEVSIPQYREVHVTDALDLYRARNEEYERLRGDVVPAIIEVDVSTSSAPTVGFPVTDIEDGR
jgi:hypothetical protein